MFDKLGDMLNECLERGEIPPPRPKRRYVQEAAEPSEAGAKPVREPITLPHDVEDALELLGLGRDTPAAGQAPANRPNEEVAPLPALSRVRSAYAKLLKEAHPDTAQKEVSSAAAAQRISQLTQAFTKIRDCYKKLGLELEDGGEE